MPYTDPDEEKIRQAMLAGRMEPQRDHPIVGGLPPDVTATSTPPAATTTPPAVNPPAITPTWGSILNSALKKYGISRAMPAATLTDTLNRYVINPTKELFNRETGYQFFHPNQMILPSMASQLEEANKAFYGGLAAKAGAEPYVPPPAPTFTGFTGAPLPSNAASIAGALDMPVASTRRPAAGLPAPTPTPAAPQTSAAPLVPPFVDTSRPYTEPVTVDGRTIDVIHPATTDAQGRSVMMLNDLKTALEDARKAAFGSDNPAGRLFYHLDKGTPVSPETYAALNRAEILSRALGGGTNLDAEATNRLKELKTGPTTTLAPSGAELNYMEYNPRTSRYETRSHGINPAVVTAAARETPEERARQIAYENFIKNGEYSAAYGLFPGVRLPGDQSSVPSQADWISEMKRRGSPLSQQQLEAFYKQRYGGG
jgi:hypothetical protein